MRSKVEKYNEENDVSTKENLDNNNQFNSLSIKDKTYPHKECINCLIKCSNYKLNITIKDEKTCSGYCFNNNYNIFYYNNSSAQQIINLIKKKEDFNQTINKETLLKLTEQKINEKEDKLLNKEITFPIENIIKENKIIIWENPTILLSNNGNNNTSSILIEIDLNSNSQDNKFFKEINKNILGKDILCSINAIVHNKANLLKNDILFSIDSKNLIKSIQYRLEDYKNSILISNQKNLNYSFKNHFFTPLHSQTNIAFSFFTNNKKLIKNINYLQTNFNSIIHKRFILDKLYIGINIPNHLANLNDNGKLNINNDTNLSFLKDSLNNQFDLNKSLNDSLEVFNQSFTHGFYNNKFNLNYSTEVNYKKKYYQNKEKVYIENSHNLKKYNNKFPDFFVKVPVRKTSEYNTHKVFKKYNYHKNYETIILNPNNLFIKNLFIKFKDNNESFCNFMIFKNFIQIENPNKKNLTIESIFNAFFKVSIYSLNIPFINQNGKIQNILYTPTISNFNIVLKNQELIEKFSKQLITQSRTSSSSTKSSFEENINNDFFIEDIKIKIFNSNELVFEFNETKPPFLRNCLEVQIQNFINNLNIGNVSIRDIDIEKSYFSISWNSVNSILINNNFLSFYLFDLTLIGIIPIKFEKEKWIKSISIEGNNFNKEYDIILSDSVKKVEDFLYFLNNSSTNFFSYSSDYEFYLRNKNN